MVNWSIVEHGLEVTKHMRHPQLGTKGVAWVGVALYWGSAPGSGQGHIKVRLRSNRLKYWIATFFTVCICFCRREVFHWATVDIMWLGSLPTRILVGGGVQRLYVACRGNTPLLYHPSSLISPPCTSANIRAKWGQLESWRTWASRHKRPETPTPGY